VADRELFLVSSMRNYPSIKIKELWNNKEKRVIVVGIIKINRLFMWLFKLDDINYFY